MLCRMAEPYGLPAYSEDVATPNPSKGGSSRLQELARRLLDDIRSGPDQRRYAALAVASVVVLYVVGLIVANSHHVRISFVLGSASISLLWLIILCVALGGVIGWILRGRIDRR
jgi:uncharacterized integral membrane protein